MRWLVLVVLAFACRDDATTQRRDEPAHDTATKPRDGSANHPRDGSANQPRTNQPRDGSAAAKQPGGNDPWQVVDDPNAPPSLLARHKLADAVCPSVTGPYFYRVEKNGKVSHVLGTRHVGVALAKFPAVVAHTIESAKLAVFEVAPDDHGSPPHKEISLPDALGPELWGRYRALVGEETAAMVQRGAPSAAMIAMIAMYEDIGAMLDMEIEQKVLAAHIPARGLERGSFQDKLLDKLLDLRMLRAAIAHTKDRGELETESRKDLHDYCAGTDDTPGMDDDMRADLLDAGYTKQQIDKMDEELVFARNRDWIPKLEEIFAKGGAFVAVGADHLSGPRGVVALLEARGYTITRITK